MDEKQIQESQYGFPYHYLPAKDSSGWISRIKGMKWGYEYLLYTSFIVDKVVSMSPSEVLEIGCGDGYISNRIFEKGINVTGVDISDRALAFAKAFSVGAKFCKKVDVTNRYEMVIVIEVLEHIEGEKMFEFVNYIASHVKENGHLIVSVPSKVVPVHKKHFRHYDVDMIKSSFSHLTELNLVETYFVYREPKWLTFMLRATFNKYFVIEPIVLSRFIWKYFRNHLMRASDADGRHIVCVFNKRSKGVR